MWSNYCRRAGAQYADSGGAPPLRVPALRKWRRLAYLSRVGAAITAQLRQLDQFSTPKLRGSLRIHDFKNLGKSSTSAKGQRLE